MNKLILTAAAIASFHVFAQPAFAQDAQAGEKKAAMCIGCHGIPGYQASFPEVHKVPMISGQNAKYIVASLEAYKKGDRKHPTMDAIAQSLSEQDMADLAAFYEGHGKAPQNAGKPAQPSPEVAELLKKANCASCHGEDYNKPIDPSYPKIAGQHADYLYVALKAYHTSNNRLIGRNNAIMAGMAKLYTLSELKKISKYLASLDGDLRTVPESRFR
ncbi:c-type cytochrome [Piscinibacter sakaiensis]|uniref:c-type cytochrome n=1 Tax=Piscinibacter sakaiensis TaxID=1547922 RepID=UPI003AADAE2A